MKILSLLLFTMLLSACYFFGPVDETVYKQPSTQPTIRQLAGKWKADSASYRFIEEKKVYKKDSLYLVLHDDSTFEAVNFPDFVSKDDDSVVNGKLYNSSGKWGIYNYNNQLTLDLNFNLDKLFKKPNFQTFQIYSRKDSALVLWLWIGDPDSGKRLLFVKE